ncbi:hypothetical protein NQZ68_013953 [Dissostichus eleginoides]|nr:hypothetical protein NQZ68_013953 [Dissostichus eleginoides]
MIPDGAWCPAERGAECVWRVRVLRVLQCVSFPRSVRRSARRSLSEERQQSGVEHYSSSHMDGAHNLLLTLGGREGPNMRVQEEPPGGLFEGSKIRIKDMSWFGTPVLTPVLTTWRLMKS